ncbi:tail assembly chaperone [Microbacterium phage Jacko]|nr:tail assembly chaperone [Microbacterium phage Jacko]
MVSMSEEIEINEGDLIVPAPADFDMFDMLSGVSYPEDTVTVALNEKAAYELAHLEQDILNYRSENEEPDEAVLAEYQSQLEEIVKRIEASKMTFHLRGVSDDLISSAGDIAEEKFKDRKLNQKAADGRIVKYLPEGEKMAYLRYLNAVTYSMHITKFVRHSDGAERVSPNADEIAAFMDKAPDAAKQKLVRAIQELRVAAANYEASLDEGFFSEVLTLPRNAWMKPIIQAAVDSGRPPLELLLDQPDRKRSRWDGMLIKGLYLSNAYDIEGYPVWVEESDAVTFEAVPRVIRSLKVVEEAQNRESKKGENARRGLRFHAEARLLPGRQWPTRKDWEERHAAGERPPEDGVVPKGAEEAEARAKAKVEADPEAQRIVAEFRERFKKPDAKME